MLSRQQVATSFLFISFLFLLKNKYVLAILINLFSAIFHLSSLVFLVVPVVALFAQKKVKLLHFVSFLMIPLSIVFSTSLILFAGSLLGSERYASYAETESVGGASFVVLMEVLSIICYLGFKKNLLKEKDSLRKLYIMAPFFTLFAPLILNDGVFIRLSKYFHVYLVIMVPIAIEHIFNKKNSILVYAVVITVLVLYSAMGSGNYSFIWQEPYAHYLTR